MNDQPDSSCWDPACPAPGMCRQAAGSKKGPYPDVQLGTFILLPLKDFGSCIGGAPAPRGQRLPWLIEIPESKICRGKGRGTGISLGLTCSVAAGCARSRHPAGPPNPRRHHHHTRLPASLMSMLLSSSRFSVLRSRWTMWWLWQYSTADRICQNFFLASFSLKCPLEVR